jgi:uncharacterized membrane protein
MAVGATGADWLRVERERDIPQPAVAQIGLADLKDALVKGLADFGANRTDVMLLCVFYPVFGLLLGRFASGAETFPLLFPLVSGFALVGPLAAVGLYEMSRRREMGRSGGWADAFGVLRSHSIGPLAVLGVTFAAIFALWMLVAQGIYSLILGPGHTASIGSFAHAVFQTPAGWALIVVGMGVGFIFAVVVLTIGVVSIPMLIDRDVGVATAVRTSVRAVSENRVTIAIWGLIVAVALLIGAIPVFLGLVIVLPVLGHATWHLYTRAVSRQAPSL